MILCTNNYNFNAKYDRKTSTCPITSACPITKPQVYYDSYTNILTLSMNTKKCRCTYISATFRYGLSINYVMPFLESSFSETSEPLVKQLWIYIFYNKRYIIFIPP